MDTPPQDTRTPADDPEQPAGRRPGSHGAGLATHEQVAGARFPLEEPGDAIEVVDRGLGIEASVIDSVFDPFYSTKFTGRSTFRLLFLRCLRPSLHLRTRRTLP